MKQRTLNNKEDLQKAAADLLNLELYLPMVMSLTEGKKIRTTKQNQRYWCDIAYFMEAINDTINNVSEHTGYTPLEVRRILAGDLDPEQAIVLYARKPEVIHDILKTVCNIPTSTRLGTKDFSKFDGILEATMAEIIGSINAVARKAGA